MALGKLKRAMCVLFALSVAGCAATPGPPRVAVATPAPDGTVCYDSDRVPFYQVANTAVLVDDQQEQARRSGQALQGIGLLLAVASLPVGGKAGQVMGVVGGLTAIAGTLTANVRTDGRLIVDFSNRFSSLVACRQYEARQIRADVRARRLTLADGRAQLRNLRDLMVTDAGIAHEVNGDLSRRNQTYILASEQIDTQLAQDPVAHQQHAAEVMQAKQTIQTNQRALTDQASAIDKAAQTITVSFLEPLFLPA